MGNTNAAPTATLKTEPPDGAIVARFSGYWPEAVYVRDDDGAKAGDYGDQHWHLVEPSNGEYPQAWADVVADARGATLVRLFREGER